MIFPSHKFRQLLVIDENIIGLDVIVFDASVLVALAF